MEHYFSDNPIAKSSPWTFDVLFESHQFKFKTDNGVFCKNHLDEGTLAFLKVLVKQKLSGRILDLGCGYGPIGIILGLIYPDSHFVLSDINPRACALAKENVSINKISNAEVVISDAFQGIEGKFNVILLNPPIRAGKKVIYSMYSEAYQNLEQNGSLFIVIRKSHGAESSEKFLETLFDEVNLLKRDKGYYIYQAIKKEL